MSTVHKFRRTQADKRAHHPERSEASLLAPSVLPLNKNVVIPSAARNLLFRAQTLSSNPLPHLSVSRHWALLADRSATP